MDEKLDFLKGLDAMLMAVMPKQYRYVFYMHTITDDGKPVFHVTYNIPAKELLDFHNGTIINDPSELLMGDVEEPEYRIDQAVLDKIGDFLKGVADPKFACILHVLEDTAHWVSKKCSNIPSEHRALFLQNYNRSIEQLAIEEHNSHG